jgi:hypothetical protein
MRIRSASAESAKHLSIRYSVQSRRLRTAKIDLVIQIKSKRPINLRQSQLREVFADGFR